MATVRIALNQDKDLLLWNNYMEIIPHDTKPKDELSSNRKHNGAYLRKYEMKVVAMHFLLEVLSDK